MSARSNIGRRMEILAALLDHEARTGRGLGVVAVAALLDREKSIVSRALTSLSASGLAERDPESLEYVVGDTLLAVAARAGDPVLIDRAVPLLRRLAADLGERAGLMVLQGVRVLTVDTAVNDGSVQAVGWAGRMTPIHCTASGRALIMDRSRAAVQDLLGTRTLFGGGVSAPRNVSELWKRLELCRRDGYSIADGELDPDVLAVAAPVGDASGTVVAAITVTGPSFRMTGHREDVVRRVLRAAAECSDFPKA